MKKRLERSHRYYRDTCKGFARNAPVMCVAAGSAVYRQENEYYINLSKGLKKVSELSLNDIINHVLGDM